jgi:hypothetical protein
MPLEICYRAMDDDKEFDNLLIEAGDGMFISSYPYGQREVVTVMCDDDGEAGLVKVRPPEGAFAEETTDYVEGDLPEPVETIKVDEDHPHEHIVTTPDGESGLFIVRYASSLAITKSLLIPEGLMYPDRPVVIIQSEEDPADPFPETTVSGVPGIEELEELPVPPQPNQEWCEWFAQKYANKGYRIGIEAKYCYYESPPHLPGPREMKMIGTLDPDTQGPALIDGEIIGSKLISWWDNRDQELKHTPYAILIDVKDADEDKYLVSADTSLLVPMDQDEGEIIILKES